MAEPEPAVVESVQMVMSGTHGKGPIASKGVSGSFAVGVFNVCGRCPCLRVAGPHVQVRVFNGTAVACGVACGPLCAAYGQLANHCSCNLLGLQRTALQCSTAQLHCTHMIANV